MAEKTSSASKALITIVPGLLAVGLMVFGFSYIGYGIFNDLEPTMPWACPGPFFEATNWIECLTPGTLFVEIPVGVVLVIVGLVLFILDKSYIQKKYGG